LYLSSPSSLSSASKMRLASQDNRSIASKVTLRLRHLAVQDQKEMAGRRKRSPYQKRSSLRGRVATSPAALALQAIRTDAGTFSRPGHPEEPNSPNSPVIERQSSGVSPAALRLW
jgi:hypothetical protein